MTAVPIWNPTERLLWGVGITLLLLCAAFYLYRGLKREDRNERLILIGFAMFILAFALHRICFFLVDFRKHEMNCDCVRLSKTNVLSTDFLFFNETY